MNMEQLAEHAIGLGSAAAAVEDRRRLIEARYEAISSTSSHIQALPDAYDLNEQAEALTSEIIDEFKDAAKPPFSDRVICRAAFNVQDLGRIEIYDHGDEEMRNFFSYQLHTKCRLGSAAIIASTLSNWHRSYDERDLAHIQDAFETIKNLKRFAEPID